MTKPSLITNTIAESQKQFAKNALKLQDAFIKELRRSVSKLSTSRGRLENNADNRKFAAGILKQVEAINKKIGLQNSVQLLFKDFGEMGLDLQKVHKDLSGIKLTQGFLSSYEEFAIQNLVYKMQGQGMDTALVQPIREALYRSVLQQGDLISTIDSLEEQLGSKDQYARYYTQTSRDALYGYAGTVNQGVANAYDLDGIMYVGDLVEDSRPQCARWVEQETLKVADLEDEIRWAYRNGSGMIAGTTSENFCELRGGYNCRHEAIPIRL